MGLTEAAVPEGEAERVGRKGIGEEGTEEDIDGGDGRSLEESTGK